MQVVVMSQSSFFLKQSMPRFEFLSNAKASLFEYPLHTSPATSASTVKLPAAVLSTSAKARTRAKKDAEQKSLAEKSASSEDTSTSSSSGNGAKPFEKDSAMQVDNTAEKKVEAEPQFEILTNPARVAPAQEKFIKFLSGSRYVPVKPAPSGFVLLRDLEPSEAEVLALTDAPSSVAPAAGSGATTTTAQPGSSAMAVDEDP